MVVKKSTNTVVRMKKKIYCDVVQFRLDCVKPLKNSVVLYHKDGGGVYTALPHILTPIKSDTKSTIYVYVYIVFP